MTSDWEYMEQKAVMNLMRRDFEREVQNLAVRMAFFEAFNIRLLADGLCYENGMWKATVNNTPIQFDYDVHAGFLWMGIQGDESVYVEDPGVQDLLTLVEEYAPQV